MNGKDAPKISITIPCYNEGKIIFDSYKELTAELKKLNESYEIIFCDDGSTDDTLKVLRNIKRQDDRIDLINYQPNRGLGYACRQLYKAASGEIVIRMDADLAVKPEEILRIFIKEIEDVDIVIGSRYAGIKPEYPLYRLIPSRVNRWLNALLFDSLFKDTNSGFYAVRKKVLDEMKLVCSDFEIDAEIFIKAKMLGFKIKEMPVKFIHKKESGEASVLRHTPKVLKDILKLWVDLKKGRWRVRS